MVTGTELEAAYRRCDAVMAYHGRTFWLASRLLSVSSRRHVAALYAFARYVDDLVDLARPDCSPAELMAQLDTIDDRLQRAIASGGCDHPLLAALVDTMRKLDLGLGPFDRFFAAMRLDVVATTFPDNAALAEYTDGSAAAIGDMMLPVLIDNPSAEVAAAARQLGVAFQLTNFVRDVVEDADRGRCYFPLDAIERSGLDWEAWVEHRQMTTEFKTLIIERIAVCRDHYRGSQSGVDALTGRPGVCIRAASMMYAGILDEVERNDYDVITSRVTVSSPRRVRLVAAAVGKGSARALW